MIRRALFEEIGWFPEHFFLYQNEMETSIRIMMEGYKIFYEPECRVVHRETSSKKFNRQRIYFPTRNSIWIIRKYFPLPGAIYLIVSRMCLGLIRAFQAWEFLWYLKSIKDALSEPVSHQKLSIPQLRKLSVFQKQNSLYHQLMDNILRKYSKK